jgi:NPCBM-associated, NEW3 domain of alpha-galactosidase
VKEDARRKDARAKPRVTPAARPILRESLRRPLRVGSAVLIYGLVTAPAALARALGADILGVEPLIVLVLVGGAMTPVIEPLTKWVADLIVGKPNQQASNPITVGDRTIRVQFGDGSVVEAHAGVKGKPEAREGPVRLLPSASAALLGRDSVFQQIAPALGERNAIEVFGIVGIGKTAVLRALSRRDVQEDDSILFVPVRGRPTADLLQFIFEAFYETPAGYKPTDAQLLMYLQDRAGLLLLDDAEMSREDIQSFADALPGCTLVTATTTQRRAGDALSVEVKGLESGAALALIERALGRGLAADELTPAAAFVTACKGRPYDLIAGAGAVRSGSKTFPQLIAEPDTKPEAERQIAISDQERAVLATIAAGEGRPVGVEHVASITGLPASDILARLEERGLAQSASPSYAPLGDAAGLLGSAELLAAREALLDYFIARAELGEHGAASPAEDLDVARTLFSWAAENGRAQKALALARHVAPALAATSQWGSWGSVLETSQRIASSVGDRSAEAWALHERGTRAFALGDDGEAKALLDKALELRRAAGDARGVSLTERNLSVVRGTPRFPGAGHGLALVWAAAVLATSGYLGLGNVIEIVKPTPIPTPSTAKPSAPPFAGELCEKPAQVTVERGRTVPIVACYINRGTTAWRVGTPDEVVLRVCCPVDAAQRPSSWKVDASATPSARIVPFGEKATFTVNITPPGNIPPGQYVLRGELVVARTGAPLQAPTFNQVVIVRPPPTTNIP